MDEQQTEMTVTPTIRMATVALTLFGGIALIDALMSTDVFDAAVLLFMLAFIAPLAVLGRPPRWYFGMSNDEINALYLGPYRIPGDRTGYLTLALLVLALSILLAIDTLLRRA